MTDTGNPYETPECVSSWRDQQARQDAADNYDRNYRYLERAFAKLAAPRVPEPNKENAALHAAYLDPSVSAAEYERMALEVHPELRAA